MLSKVLDIAFTQLRYNLHINSKEEGISNSYGNFGWIIESKEPANITLTYRNRPINRHS